MELNEGIPVTSHITMLYDENIYKIYIILKENKYNKMEIKAFSKVCNINYIEASKKLKNKKNLIGEGNAYYIKDILKQLSQYDIDYEIIPPYCY